MALAYPRSSARPLALLLALTPLACGDSSGGTASGTTTGVTGVTTVPTSATGTSDTAPTGSDSASGSSSGVAGTDSASGSGDTGQAATTEDVLKLDIGAGQTTAGETGEVLPGCRKVDFLFIIDNSGSMSEEQKNLINSFPSFIETIQQELEEAQDYHIMVIDSDAYVFAGCETICPLFFDFCPGGGADYKCGITQPEECEDVLGAGVIHPKGENSSGKACNFSSQARYMDVSEPDLTAAFACAAQVGTGSSDEPERPMQAMVAAVAPNGLSAECNLGFIRQDAILVVTVITDEDDNEGDGSLGNVEGWRASLIAAKKGDETALAVLGLIGDTDKPNPMCGNEEAESSPRLRQFIESFGERGVVGSVCAPSYKTFFQQAVGIIDSTCESFVPPPM